MELTAAEAWSRILESARGMLPEQGYQTWLAPTSPVGLANNVLVISAPNPFAAEWIEDKYGVLLASQAHALFGSALKLSFESRPNTSQLAPKAPAVQLTGLEEAEPEADETRVRTTGRCAIGALNPRYTLSRFVIARNNELAAAACKAVVEEPGRTYNPLFLHGGVGLGKTHLMHAIGHAVLERTPDARVAYVASEQFTNELIESIQGRRTTQFRNRFRTMDLLLVDDVHFLADKDATQEELFHTFNALYDRQKQIVLASDRPPSAVLGLQDRLVSRFEWGLVTDLKPPDYETRLAILQLKAEHENLELGHDVLSLIASRCDSSVRALEGAVIKLLAYSSLTREEMTPELAERLLSSALRAGRAGTAAEIAAAVAAYFGVSEKALASKSRARDVALPRQVAMYLIKQILDLPYTMIGRHFGGRDHSTVIHAVRKVDKLAQSDPAFRQKLEELRSQLAGKPTPL